MGDIFDRIRGMLKDAVRATFSGLRAKIPEQTFYAFVLYDADGTGPNPAANSEERWRAQVKRNQADGADDRFLYRWGHQEWSYEGIDTESFHPICELLQAEHDRWGAELSLRPDSDEWLDFQGRSYGTSIAALKELSDEGFFGSGAKRVTVFFSITDDEDAVWLERESARWINPPDVFAAFEPEWRIAALQQYAAAAFRFEERAEHLTRLFSPREK